MSLFTLLVVSLKLSNDAVLDTDLTLLNHLLSVGDKNQRNL